MMMLLKEHHRMLPEVPKAAHPRGVEEGAGLQLPFSKKLFTCVLRQGAAWSGPCYLSMT